MRSRRIRVVFNTFFFIREEKTNLFLKISFFVNIIPIRRAVYASRVHLRSSPGESRRRAVRAAYGRTACSRSAAADVHCSPALLSRRRLRSGRPSSSQASPNLLRAVVAVCRCRSVAGDEYSRSPPAAPFRLKTWTTTFKLYGVRRST